MLTILHDEILMAGQPVETAWAEGISIIAPQRATCLLARALIRNGYDPKARTRLVKADPYLACAPHHIGGLTLSLAAEIDFFGEPDGPADTIRRAPAGPDRRA